MGDLPLAVALARRELRGGLRGFAVFIACLFLGVGAIAGVGSMSAAVQDAIRADARVLMGGDLALRLTHRTAAPDQIAWLRDRARVTAGAEMRAMATAADGRRALVELKSVDGAYPLYGEMRLTPAMPLDAALAAGDGLPGAVVEEALAQRLDLAPGDRLRIGEAEFALRAVIEREPDRGISALTLGPRVMISEQALAATGLVQPGSLIRFHYRLRLPDGADLGAFADALARAFPDAGWRVSRVDTSAPGLGPVLRRLTLFLTLVGLTALLVGGIGVGNAVRAHLDGRAKTIAILKCLGASGGLVSRVYLIQILLIAGVAILAGLAAGALAPVAGAGLIGELLPVRLRTGLHAGPLALAALFGLLTALVFTLWPLGRARETPAAGLFRNAVTPGTARPRGAYLAGAALAAAALAGLAIATAVDRPMAIWFVGGTAATLTAFVLAARGLRALARRAARPAGAGRVPGLRLALANIARPGAPTGSIVVSVGAGLAVLIALALIQGNLARQIAEQLPARAPSFFFINILPDQMDAFARTVRQAAPDADLENMPSLRGRITHIAGVPVAQAAVAQEARWALDSDRGLTYAAAPPPGTDIVAGSWWPADYAGPPLISFAAGLAHGMGLEVGDSITLNVLGREVEARIANLRAVDWRSLGINFTFIFAPGTLEAAPHSFIATVRADAASEAAIFRAVAEAHPNVTVIRVRDAIDAVSGVLREVGLAIRASAGVTLLAGLLVLAGAVAASHHGRVRDAVILKVLGARRRDMLRAFLWEFGLIGAVTAAIAALAGTAASYGVMTEVMMSDWVMLPGAVVATAAACVAVTLAFGFAGTWRALGRKAAPFLRND